MHPENKFRLLTAVSLAAATGLTSCGYENSRVSPEVPLSKSPPTTEASPINLVLRPFKIPESNGTLCTNPDIYVSVPEDLWGTRITGVDLRTRREGEEKFSDNINLLSYPNDPNHASTILPVPVPGDRMETIDIIVEAVGPDGNIVGSNSESMEVGCIEAGNIK